MCVCEREVADEVGIWTRYMMYAPKMTNKITGVDLRTCVRLQPLSSHPPSHQRLIRQDSTTRKTSFALLYSTHTLLRFPPLLIAHASVSFILVLYLLLLTLSQFPFPQVRPPALSTPPRNHHTCIIRRNELYAVHSAVTTRFTATRISRVLTTHTKAVTVHYCATYPSSNAGAKLL